MNKVYVIVMLCNDDDRIYIDYVNKIFDTFKSACEEMTKCIFSELESLGSGYYIEDLGIDSEVETYEMEIVEDTDDKKLITRYEVIRIDK